MVRRRLGCFWCCCHIDFCYFVCFFLILFFQRIFGLLIVFCESMKPRYVCGTILGSIRKVTGIIKIDLLAQPDPGKTKLEVGGNVEGICDLRPCRFGSEAIFVPRKGGITSEEDDGYLILFVPVENTGGGSVA